MADAPPEDLPLASNGEVKAYDRVGNKITVPKEKVGELYGMGGRVAAKAEVTAQQLEADYATQSTAKKIAGYATALAPPPVQSALQAAGVTAIGPERTAFNSGLSSAGSGGLDEVATKAALSAIAGPEAGKAYGKHILDAREAHGGYYTAGQVAGFGGAAISALATGGASTGLRGLAGGGIAAAGGATESLAARGLGGLAARGSIGRALATGGELAARGAVEGGLYGAAESINEQSLGDHDLAADKVFAAMGTGALYGGLGGAAIGGAGSLATSAYRATKGAALSGIGRALSKGEDVAASAGARAESAATEARALGKEAVEGAVSDTRAAASGIAEATGTRVEQEIGSMRDGLAKMGEKGTQHGWSQDQAWKAMGAGQGLQSTSFAKSAERYLPNGTRDVGEVILRKGVINVEDGIFNAARHGTPEAMLPRIEAEREIVGRRIGDMTAASPARISGVEIGDAVSRVAGQYEQSAATRPVGKALRVYAENLRDSLGINSLDSSVPIQDLLRERKALDRMVFENASLDPSLAIQVKRELRGELEGLVVKGLDEAGGKLPGEVRAEYKALKHDYTALSIAADATADSAARMAKGATFGLTDTLRGGGSIIKTVASKLVRERGNAAAAVLLSRMADMGTITRAIRSVDDQVGRAATGILSAPRKAPLPSAIARETPRVRAEKAMRSVAEMDSRPEQIAERATSASDSYRTTAPNLAGAVTQRLTSAHAFLSSKMPSVPDPDPFDPHPAPMLTDAQAAEYAAYADYAHRPMLFFEEAEHGKLTFEGVETARALMPGAFAEMQQRTVEGLADLMAKGKPPPYLARQRMGVMLGIPAVPEQRPDHMVFLQANVLGSEKAEKASPGAQSVPKRPLPTKTQSSTLDRLEGK